MWTVKGKIKRCGDKELASAAQEGGNSISEERQNKKHGRQNSSYGYGGGGEKNKLGWGASVTTRFTKFD